MVGPLRAAVRPSGVPAPAGGDREQADSLGALHGLLAAVRAELAVQVPQVGLDRVRRDVELGGDLWRAHMGRQVAQHASLALGEQLVRPGRFAGWWRWPVAWPGRLAASQVSAASARPFPAWRSS